MTSKRSRTRRGKRRSKKSTAAVSNPTPNRRTSPDSSTAIRPRDRERLSQLASEVAVRTFTRDQIHQWQQEIHEQTLILSRSIDQPNFQRVGNDDVARMIRMYDDRFFGGKILPVAAAEGIKFGLSSRMTSIAGKLVTNYPDGTHSGRRSFELVLSSTLLFQTFEDVDRPVEVTGRRCQDRLEAMQRIAEHEFVHLIEMLIWNDGNCSESRFQSIARRYFDHTDYRHDLITQRERAARKFNVRVGDQVRFAHDGQYHLGRVNRITRRATVLVPNASGKKFSDGKRYLRFYVPLEQLEKINV